MGGAQRRCGQERKISALLGFDPRTVRAKGKVLTGFWWRHLGERDQLEKPGVVGRIILRWIFKRRDGGHKLD